MDLIADSKVKNLSPEFLFNVAIRNNLAVCIYKLPESDYLHVLIDPFPEDINLSQPLELNKLNGFIFGPFIADSYHPGILIKHSFHFIYKIKGENFECVYHPSAFPFELIEKKGNWPVFDGRNLETSKADFETAVSNVVEAIKAKKVQKVVLSRATKRPLASGFTPITFLKKLIFSYKNAFISLLATEKTGTWIGATPEILVNVDKANIFKTISLAGTKCKDPDSKTSETLWSQKEIEEQALVSRYIINCFKKIRVREFDEIGPKTIEAGDLLHLKTEFYVDQNQINFENLAGVMLNLLHPTSAVCGMPKGEALEIINDLEKHQRAYFTGFLGPVGISPNESLSTQTNIFVNIRCMQLLEKEAVFYAGAGITEDSIPEKEYDETLNKINTLLKIFEGI